MFSNLLLISLRSLAKRKFYSLLNISGLAVSISFAFLLWMYVNDQNSYDRHYKNANRIYRINASLNMNGKQDIYSNGPRPVASLFKSDFPEVEETVRIKGVGGLEMHTGLFVLDDKKIQSKEAFVVDSTVFNIFEREFVAGNPRKALTEPNSLVLTETLSMNIFGTTESLGKTVDLRTEGKFLKVTGIIKDDNRKTHLPMSAFVSWTTFPRPEDITQWYGAHVYTYMLLREGSDIQDLRKKVPAFFTKYMKAEFDKFNGTADLLFQPLKDIHLTPEFVWEAYRHGSKSNVVALTLVMAFLLVFACINYINLATARATERASEVGIRKTLGSSKRALMAQFLNESMLLAIFSGAIALLMSWLLLPFFSQLTGFYSTDITVFDTQHISMLFITTLGIGLLAGIYPAFYLSSLNAMQSLKGKFSGSKRGEVLRKILVTSQYFIAATLIASILFVWEQTSFIKNKDIGYNKNNLLSVIAPDDTTVLNHLGTFAEKVKTSSHVLGATLSYFQLNKEANHFTPTLENADGTTFQMGADFIVIDPDFIKTLDADLVQGRSFNASSEADEKTFMINEAAMHKFGWTKNTLANRFRSWSASEGDGDQLELIGVVKDFNLGVSYHSVNPMIIFFNKEEGGSTVFIRLRPESTLAGMSAIRQMWQETFPGQQPEITFINQSLNALYSKEEKFLDLLATFSGIILFIASLGIIGLISFTTVLKKKEIAIRKVLGSPVQSIIVLLSKRFVVLLVVANALAVPVTYYLVSQWLNNFTYRISFHPWPFAIAILLCVFFTTVSLLYHTAIAATANPVDALRNE